MLNWFWFSPPLSAPSGWLVYAAKPRCRANSVDVYLCTCIRTLLTGDRRMPLCIGTPLSRGVLMAAPLRRLVSRTVNRPGRNRDIGVEGKSLSFLDLGFSRLRLSSRLCERICPCNRGRAIYTGDSLRKAEYVLPDYILRKKIRFKRDRCFSLVYLTRGNASRTSGDQIVPLPLSLSLSLCVYELQVV